MTYPRGSKHYPHTNGRYIMIEKSPNNMYIKIGSSCRSTLGLVSQSVRRCRSIRAVLGAGPSRLGILPWRGRFSAVQL